MKKIICMILAVATIFCFAGCDVLSLIGIENDKCDICEKKTEKCEVYEDLDNQELCPECAVKEGLKKGIDNIFG